MSDRIIYQLPTIRFSKPVFSRVLYCAPLLSPDFHVIPNLEGIPPCPEEQNPPNTFPIEKSRGEQNGEG